MLRPLLRGNTNRECGSRRVEVTWVKVMQLDGESEVEYPHVVERLIDDGECFACAVVEQLSSDEEGTSPIPRSVQTLSVRIASPWRTWGPPRAMGGDGRVRRGTNRPGQARTFQVGGGAKLSRRAGAPAPTGGNSPAILARDAAQECRTGRAPGLGIELAGRLNRPGRVHPAPPLGVMLWLVGKLRHGPVAG